MFWSQHNTISQQIQTRNIAKTPKHERFIERKMKMKKIEQTTHTDVTVFPCCAFVHCVTPWTHVIIGIAAVVVIQAFTCMPIYTDTEEWVNRTVECVCVCEYMWLGTCEAGRCVYEVSVSPIFGTLSHSLCDPWAPCMFPHYTSCTPLQTHKNTQVLQTPNAHI